MKKTILLSTVLFFTIHSFAQNIINNHSYSFDNDLDGWSSQTIENEAVWIFTDNGQADDGVYWDDRMPIKSKSLGGAAKIDGDDLVNSEVGNPANDYIAALVSPDLDFSGSPNVYLRFQQYYRNFDAEVYLEYMSAGGNWQPVTTLNQTVNINVETGTEDYQVIDLSTLLGDSIGGRVRFVFEGQYYFWILDDIEFYDAFPISETVPSYVGDSLQNFGFPYETDDSNWPYVPMEIVVQFKQDTPEADRQLIREEFAAERVDSCACGRLELWRLGDDLIVDGDTLGPDGGSIGIQERIKGAKAKASIDGVDYNRYNYNQMQDVPVIPNPPFLADELALSPTPDAAIRIAILDTGIELTHDSLRNVLHRNTNEPPEANEIDEDGNCLKDDWYGWNFVDNNNNPTDDHSHGTHVAGIVWQNFKDQDPTCDYRLIPYKTHDRHGVATLFDVACATYQAQEDGASVINDSWGFYGNPSEILSNAVDTAKLNNVLIITAAGNDTTDLSTLPQYPACYTKSNIITVGAFGLDGGGSKIIAPFSNFDPVCVDILADGISVTSTVLNNEIGDKSGTSMAAPAVTAAAAMVYCFDPDKNYFDIRENILRCASKNPAFENFARDGNVLNFDYPCLTPIEELLLGEQNQFSLYPNPISNILHIDNSKSIESGILNIHSLNGSAVASETFQSWLAGEQKSINLENLPAGIYILSIQNDLQTNTYKLIKQ